MLPDLNGHLHPDPLNENPDWCQAKEIFEFPPIDCDKILASTPRINIASLYEVYENRFPDIVTLARRLGVHHSSGTQEFYDPYQKKRINEDFSNIFSHLVFVAKITGVLANLLIAAQVIDEAQGDAAERRAMLHDLGKPFDIFLNAHRRRQDLTARQYLDDNVFDEAVRSLETETGIDRKYADEIVRGFGQETGGRPETLRKFFEVGPYGLVGIRNLSWPTKIVHLADDLACSLVPAPSAETEHLILTPLERLFVTSQPTKAPDGLRMGFGVLENGEVGEFLLTDMEKSGAKPLGSLFAVSNWISSQICSQYVRALDIRTELDPVLWVKRMLTDTFANQGLTILH